MKITGLKSFLASIELNVTQVQAEIRKCYIPDQYRNVYYKMEGMEQVLTNLKDEIADERTIGYIDGVLDSLKAHKNFCKARY